MNPSASAAERPLPWQRRWRRRRPRPPRYQHSSLRQRSGDKQAAFGVTVALPPADAVAVGVRLVGCCDGGDGRNDKSVVVAAAGAGDETSREHGFGGAERQHARYRCGSDSVTAAAASPSPSPRLPSLR